jgi:hypothetical protein
MRTFHKSESDGDYILAPEGTGAATLTVLAFLGRHRQTFQGQTKERELVGLSYELAERAGEDGRALSVNETLTFSMHEKAKFFARIKALCAGREPPEGFDLGKLLGRSYLITVAHEARDGNTYANIAGVSPILRGMQVLASSVPPIGYDIDDRDAGTFDLLPARFRKMIEAAGGGTSAPNHRRDVEAMGELYGGPKSVKAPAPHTPAPSSSGGFDDDIPW